MISDQDQVLLEQLAQECAAQNRELDPIPVEAPLSAFEIPLDALGRVPSGPELRRFQTLYLEALRLG